MTELPFHVDREIVICATRATVFRYFTDSERFAAWWGAGSRIDPRPGGEICIRYPGDAVARGTVVEIVAGERIVFTYGYERAGAPIAPGGSRVTITLGDVAGGTRVHLRHDVHDAAVADGHVDGWRYQMALFGNVVATEQHAGAPARIDAYLAAWSETDPTARRAALAACCADDVVYRDRYGYATGVDDLVGHIGAAQRHLPARLERTGAPRLSLGLAVVDWQARRGDGDPTATGTSVIELAPDGRIARVTGVWS